ncbi:Amylo-alpha-1,6-glucosidase [uncultured archaeon]|nr:Amylo-alpha-1,6-glucosidase [uncultured archaeon]
MQKKTVTPPMAGARKKGVPTLNPNQMSLEQAETREWLLTNGIGGYSSQTIASSLTRKYHGLLIHSTPTLVRRMLLSKLEDVIETAGGFIPLTVNHYADGTIEKDGLNRLQTFEYQPHSIKYQYKTEEASIEKTLWMPQGHNAVIASYKVKNAGKNPVTLRIHPLVTSRNHHNIIPQKEQPYKTKQIADRAVAVETNQTYLLLYSDKLTATPPQYLWHNNIQYPQEIARGEEGKEDLYHPTEFTITLPEGKEETFTIIATGGLSEAEAAASFTALTQNGSPPHPKPTGNPEPIMTLLATAQSFIVAAQSKKTVIAGYHWFNDWGRDAMISLPGLTLTAGHPKDAQDILDYFLNKVQNGRIPTEIRDGKPDFRSYDDTLWMIDRVLKYIEYVGEEEGRRFLHTHWWTIKSIMAYYASQTKGGLLKTPPEGTWMDTLSRPNAVEIQALWYNALHTYNKLAEVMKDSKKEIDVDAQIKDFEKAFMPTYYAGTHLKDTPDDDSIRPNQIIALALNHTPVPKEEAKKILQTTEKRLLTPYGLRTLDPSHPNYCGRYVGDPQERARAYHNGTVWPYLMGSYVDAYVKFNGENTGPHLISLLEPLVAGHILEAGLGTVSECFDGDPPHTPRGCISQAWSVAEVIRAYFAVRGKN